MYIVFTVLLYLSIYRKGMHITTAFHSFPSVLHKTNMFLTLSPLFFLKCRHDNEERMKRLKRYQTDDAKKKRVQRKVSRAEEQELR